MSLTKTTSSTTASDTYLPTEVERKVLPGLIQEQASFTARMFTYGDHSQISPYGQDMYRQHKRAKKIRGGKMPEKMFADHLQCVINHEIGHTLGLAHNMAGSQAYTIEQLLNPEISRRMVSAPPLWTIYTSTISSPPGRKRHSTLIHQPGSL